MRQKSDQAPNPTRLCVIDVVEASKIKYTAKNVFMAYRVRARTSEHEILAYKLGGPTAPFFREESKTEWVLLQQVQKEYLESISRSKVAKKPQIHDNSIESLRANLSKS